jgi:NOL1/NOP2/fmu family ribosome biogenesis protein
VAAPLQYRRFFSARLIKGKSIPTPSVPALKRSPRPPQVKIPLPVESSGIIHYLSDQYGFELGQLIEENCLQIAEVDGQISLIGETLNSQFPDLPWLSSGMVLGKALPDIWQPSHEFVSRFGDRFTRNVLILEEAYLAGWMRGEDIRGYAAHPELRGNVVAVRDALGRNLGRARVLENRLKNLLPTRLF